MRTSLSLLALFLLTATANAQTQSGKVPTPPRSPLAKSLVGEWYNLYVRIQLSSGTIMEADSANWEARLGIKPIHTFFQPDGSYYSEYRNTKDSIVRRPAGFWQVNGDSLVMQETTPAKSTLTLQVKIENGVATFNGLIDFDGEGKNNDAYLGRQRKKATSL